MNAAAALPSIVDFVGDVDGEDPTRTFSTKNMMLHLMLHHPCRNGRCWVG